MIPMTKIAKPRFAPGFAINNETIIVIPSISNALYSDLFFIIRPRRGYGSDLFIERNAPRRHTNTAEGNDPLFTIAMRD